MEHRQREHDDELTCRELVELITTYIEGGMGEGERRQVEAHLARCGGCDAYLEQMRLTIRLAGQVGDRPLSEGERGELLALFRRARGEGEGGALL